MPSKKSQKYTAVNIKPLYEVACSSPNGLLPLPRAGIVESLCDALLVASSMTALKLDELWLADFGGSLNGLCSVAGESTIRVGAEESRRDPDAAGEMSESESGFDLGGRWALTFLTLPTRTTMARAGVAVAVLALLRKVEPTLKVLFAGLGGRGIRLYLL